MRVLSARPSRIVSALAGSGQFPCRRAADTEGKENTRARSYAVPVSTAVSIADKIEAGQASGSVHIGATAFLGVALLPQGSLPGSTGVTVAGVEPGLPAARAGLQPGDQITSVAGHQVSTPADVQGILGSHHPGSKISISWLDQAGQAHTATVALAAARPADQPASTPPGRACLPVPGISYACPMTSRTPKPLFRAAVSNAAALVLAGLVVRF